MAEPSLIAYFALNGQKDPVPTELLTGGYSPSIPNVHGYQLNSIFNQVVASIHYLRSKGFGFWDDTKAYYATAGEIDIVRDGSKIYFALQDSNIDGLTPKAPSTNPTYWGVMYDFAKPVYDTFALLGGSATQKFKVLAGAATDEAVNLGQLNGKAAIGGSNTQKFKVATPTADDEAATFAQVNGKAAIGGSNTQKFKVATPTADDEAATFAQLKTKIGAADYASADGTIGGTIKARVSGSALYLRTDGTNA